jgi:hypothetical protein
LTVAPGDNTSPDYNSDTDVDRLITYNYNQSAADWVATFEYGYKQTEEPTYTNAAAGYDHTSLRFREVAGGSSEKVATGQATTGIHNGGEIFASRTLPGIQPGTATLAQIDNPAPLFLRGGPTTFISIAHGRWSNPATWDEGVEPGSGDNVIIADGTQVHTGGTAPNRDNYSNDETSENAMASSVLIQSNGALIFGTDIAGGEAYAMSPNTTITVADGANTIPTTVTSFADFLNTNPAGFDGRGLIIFNSSTGAGITSVASQNYDINGLLYNDGELQVCD